MKETIFKSKKPSYRVLYNQDSTSLFSITKELIEPRHVDKMVDEVADGGADVMLINVNAQRVNYHSKVWQTYWDGYGHGKKYFFGSIPKNEVVAREHWIKQMAHLAGQGCNYLACALQRCRQRRIVPGISVRMNDMHDASWLDSHLFSRFYLEHTELHLSNPEQCSWGGTGLNYALEPTHQHYLSLIQELVTNYDFEVLELDFLRFANYFPRGSFDIHCKIMIEFIRKVRKLLVSSGRSITLIVRIASTPAGAKELGFDVGAFASEGLVDAITFGMFLNTGWEMTVGDFRELTGDNIALYFSTDYAADHREGLEIRALPLNPRMIRGVVSGYLASGADGVSFFNFFCTREEEKPIDPIFSIFHELKSLDVLRDRQRVHLITAGTTQLESDIPSQVPVVLDTNQSRKFELLLASAPEKCKVTAYVVFEGGDTIADLFWMRINNTPLGFSTSIESNTLVHRQIQTAIFSVPTGLIRDGKNSIIFRNEGKILTILGLEIHVE